MVNIVDASGDVASRSYVDWPAIIAGAVLATAISFILFAFGSAVGLGVLSPYHEMTVPPLALVALSAAWIILVAIISFTCGAYLTGRLRRRFFDATEHESTVRDGAHGLLVWAATVMIGVILAALSAANILQAGATVTAGAFGGVGAGANQFEDGGTALVTDLLLRPAPGSSSVAPGPVPAPGPAATAPAANAPVANAPPDTAPPLAAYSANGGRGRADTRAEIGRMIGSGLMSNGDISPDDRSYLAVLVSRETGMPQAEAEARVRSTLDRVIAQSKRAADVARKVGIMVAFLTAATLLLCAVGCWWAAGRGGFHRDNSSDLGPMWR